MCDKCQAYGGRWMMTDNGLKRCECQPKLEPIMRRAPVLTSDQAAVFVEMLVALPWFPNEGGARVAIGDELKALCAGPNEALWLVTRMGQLYERWPGTLEMRRVYASRHIPHDGVLPVGISEHFPDGIPSERPAMTAPAMKALPGERRITAAESFDRAIVALGVAKDLDRVGLPKMKVPEPPIVRITEVNRITQADIDREMEKRRTEKAKAEIA